MANAGYHESVDQLSEKTRDMHRALVSLMEELEAIDWYRQRADACSEAELTEVLIHNQNEEIEHAAMLMEWLRRHDDRFDAMMRKYLFREQSIVGIEAGAEKEGASGTATPGLGIGSMKAR